MRRVLQVKQGCDVIELPIEQQGQVSHCKICFFILVKVELKIYHLLLVRDYYFPLHMQNLLNRGLQLRIPRDIQMHIHTVHQQHIQLAMDTYTAHG